MSKRGLSQEWLKVIACAAMLIDHIGATIVLTGFYNAPVAQREQLLELYELLRRIGRLAFPIYCFLLVEGCAHTKNPVRYGLRMAVAALLSEIPFDLAFYGGINWQRQNVMVTLLLGLMTLETMKKCPKLPMKFLAVVPYALLAEWAGSDYGADGIMLIVLFFLTRGHPRALLLQLLGMWFIFSPGHRMALNWLAGIRVTNQELSVLALLPIHLYSGRKAVRGRWVQWLFYLFYPAHLLGLYLLGRA